MMIWSGTAENGAFLVDSDLLIKSLEQTIRVIPDFPKKGVKFKDITPLLADPQAFHTTITLLGERYREEQIDAVLGLEARGFIFGAALAYHMNLPFIPVRKRGKLPGETYSVEYEKEYGTDAFEIQTQALTPGQNVLVVDDVIAVGGTAEAACALVRQAGAQVVEVACILEVPDIPNRRQLSVPVFILLP